MPSLDEKVREVFSKVGLGENDTVVDLGCGDGRVLFEAITFGCRKAIGIELNHELVEKLKENVALAEVQDKIEIIEADFLNADISTATIIYIYLLPDAIEKLKPLFLQALNSHTRILISAHFSIKNWKRSQEFSIDGYNCYTLNSINS